MKTATPQTEPSPSNQLRKAVFAGSPMKKTNLSWIQTGSARVAAALILLSIFLSASSAFSVNMWWDTTAGAGKWRRRHRHLGGADNKDIQHDFDRRCVIVRFRSDER